MSRFGFDRIGYLVPTLALGLALCFPLDVLGQWCDPQPFGTLVLAPAWKIDGSGENVDSIAFWEHDTDPDATLMFVTAKDNSLVEVWRHPFDGSQLTTLTHSSFGTANVNGVIVDQQTDRLYVSVGTPENTVSVFDLPGLNFLFGFSKSAGTDYGIEPNLALTNPTQVDKLIFVSSADSVYVHDAADGTYLDEWRPTKGLETMAADSFYQAIYIPDENTGTGVYAYKFNGSSFNRSGTNVFGAGDFDADAEGIVVVTCSSEGSADDGSGFIVVADQVAAGSEFEFYDRSDWSHLGVLKLTGVSNTDGIASSQRSMTGYPNGIFVAIDDDSMVAGIGWDFVFGVTTNLPVQLSSLRVALRGNSAILAWRTESEAKNSGFEVQHARERGAFETIGFVAGKGTSSEPTDYSYIVPDLGHGRHVFRLQQIDLDGSAVTSPQVEVLVELPGDFHLSEAYPNPFSDATELEVTVSSPQRVRVVVLDGLGRQVQELLDTMLEAGQTRVVRLEAAGLASGRYVVRVQGDSFSESRHVILMR